MLTFLLRHNLASSEILAVLAPFLTISWKV